MTGRSTVAVGNSESNDDVPELPRGCRCQAGRAAGRRPPLRSPSRCGSSAGDRDAAGRLHCRGSIVLDHDRFVGGHCRSWSPTVKPSTTLRSSPRARTSTARAGSSARPVPPLLRPASAGKRSRCPGEGVMSFEPPTWNRWRPPARWVTSSPMRWGMCWHRFDLAGKGLLQGASSSNPDVHRAAAMAEYAALLEAAATPPVPVENTGGAGTRGAHWRETVFRNELMSGFIDAPGNPISRVDLVASLGDSAPGRRRCGRAATSCPTC